MVALLCTKCEAIQQAAAQFKLLKLLTSLGAEARPPANGLEGTGFASRYWVGF